MPVATAELNDMNRDLFAVEAARGKGISYRFSERVG
jgi:hypothetical protein